MMNNLNNLMGIYQQLRQNPMQVLSQRFNIPPNIDLNNPNSVVQYLLNSGQVSQTQINQVMEMRNNPMIKNMFGIH